MIQRVMLSDQVKEELLDQIISGHYQPGDRLVESQIARELGISQCPVREALRDLMAMRFVEMLPYKGARVRMVEDREVLDIFPVRAVLEELAGQLAAPAIADRLDELEEAVVRMTEAVEARDPREVSRWDVLFHRTILNATGNQILIETWNSLMIEARTFVTSKNLMESGEGLDLAARHQKIIDALREDDPATCGNVMRAHVEEFGVQMQGLLSDSRRGEGAARASEADEQDHSGRTTGRR